MTKDMQIFMLGHLGDELLERSITVTSRSIFVRGYRAQPFGFLHFHKGEFLLSFFIKNPLHSTDLTLKIVYFIV